MKMIFLKKTIAVTLILTAPLFLTMSCGISDGPSLIGSVGAGVGKVLPELQLSAGFQSTCALSKTGRLRCWGSNGYGQLGQGNTQNIGDNEYPDSISDVNLGEPVQKVSHKNSSPCVLLKSGNVRCWGYNSNGQLGLGNKSNLGDIQSILSVNAIDFNGEKVVDVEAGSYHNCVILEGGSVRCWGFNDKGQLGLGNMLDLGDDELPKTASPISVGGPVTQLALGGEHTCALVQGGLVRCWGKNNVGQLGLANTLTIGDNEPPSSLSTYVNVGGAVKQISAGGNFTCALLENGDVRCWGANNYGQLGQGNTNPIGDNEYPSSVPPVSLGGKVTKISSGLNHTCALLENGDVRCWGIGNDGVLGTGNTNHIGDNEKPDSISPVSLGENAVDIAAGNAHNCAILESGKVICWGNGFQGALGQANSNNIGDDELPSILSGVRIGF